MEEEVPLTGGRVTPGVVRVADTVRRPAAANAGLMRPFLAYLASQGFDAASAFLGVDARGRDILSFIDGEVPTELAHHGDDTLRRAAALIRRFHDLGAAFVTSERPGTGAEVVCHNDLSPCNFVFRVGRPVAIIDFDAAAPGTRAHDLGYAAWLWLDLGTTDIEREEQRRRFALFLDAYGSADAGPVIAATLERQRLLAAEGRRIGNGAMTAWAESCLAWTTRNAWVLAGHGRRIGKA